MFYSHEILTSRQYGVSTIWLVATVGKGTATRKVTKKAIQEVDVQKACGKIIEPGAPVALRLQGQLLYGVSKVFNQQCSYMLADLQKIQMHMHIFFTKFGHNQLDPEAGHTRPENLIIMNDPDFVPEMRLPHFDLDALVAVGSQMTNKTSSQMSPLDASPSVSGYNMLLQLEDSDSSGPRGSPFGIQGLSSAQKQESDRVHIQQDDEFAGAGNWGMDIDENGDIIELDDLVIAQDDLELPPLPRMEGDDQEQANKEQQDQPFIDDQGDIIIMEDEQPRPEAEALPERQVPDEHDPFQDDNQQDEPVPLRRKKKARVLHADEETQISRNVIRQWQDNYAENCTVKKVRATAPARAKANAMLLTFGLGLGNIGQNLGVPGMVHPLTLEFSGDSLFTAITGLKVPEAAGGKRHRSASEPIEDDEEQDERRVRPRLDSDAGQQGRGQPGNNDEFVIFEDEQLGRSSPEVGREAQAAMSDHLSSALRMPWNQGSSALHGSSVPGSAQKGGRIPSSPLANRGNTQEIMRFSDDGSMGFDFDMGGGGMHSQDDDFQMRLGAEGPEEAATESQQQPALDLEGQKFFSFMETAARDTGERRADEDYEVNRRWVAFDDCFVPRETQRDVAVHAFYHALSLATKGKMKVSQESPLTKPFGDIWIGVTLSDDANATRAADL